MASPIRNGPLEALTAVTGFIGKVANAIDRRVSSIFSKKLNLEAKADSKSLPLNQKSNEALRKAHDSASPTLPKTNFKQPPAAHTTAAHVMNTSDSADKLELKFLKFQGETANWYHNVRPKSNEKLRSLEEEGYALLKEVKNTPGLNKATAKRYEADILNGLSNIHDRMDEIVISETPKLKSPAYAFSNLSNDALHDIANRFIAADNRLKNPLPNRTTHLSQADVTQVLLRVFQEMQERDAKRESGMPFLGKGGLDA